MRALVELGAIGLVTTHDLALTELPAQLGAAAVNVHFEDQLETGRWCSTTGCGRASSSTATRWR